MLFNFNLKYCLTKLFKTMKKINYFIFALLTIATLSLTTSCGDKETVTPDNQIYTQLAGTWTEVSVEYQGNLYYDCNDHDNIGWTLFFYDFTFNVDKSGVYKNNCLDKSEPSTYEITGNTLHIYYSLYGENVYEILEVTNTTLTLKMIVGGLKSSPTGSICTFTKN